MPIDVIAGLQSSPSLNRRKGGTMRRALGISVLLLVAACGAGTSGSSDPDWRGDDAAYLACEDLARWAVDGKPISDRLERFEGVSRWAQDSTTEGLAHLGTFLVNAAVAGDEAMITSNADAFSARCLELGWEQAQR